MSEKCAGGKTPGVGWRNAGDPADRRKAVSAAQ